MMLRIRFQIGRRQQEAQPEENLGSLPIASAPNAGSLGASLLVHGLAVFLTILVSQQMASDREPDLDWSKYKVEMIRLNIAEPLYFSAKRPEGNAAKPRPDPPAQPAGQLSAPQAASAAGGRALPPRLELPAPTRAPRNAPVVIQPELRAELPPPAALPPMAFWARRSPELPRPKPSTEIVPGRAEAPSEAPKLAAPPSAAVPNKEQAVADRNVSLQLTETRSPALPVQNSTTMPVRLRDAKDSHAASFDPAAGQPVNVIALAPEQHEIRNVEIPRGAQNIPATQTAEGVTPGPAGGSSGSNPNGISPQSRQAAPGTGGVPDGRAAGSRAANSQSNGAANGPGTAPANSPQSDSGISARGSASAPGFSTAVAAAASAPARASGTPPATRIEHPVNGNFDVVIMQSATRDDLLSQGETLTGNPVYSVYLRVGDRKEWVLEYCVPAAQNAQGNPYQINIDDSGTIMAPYPITTVIPVRMAGQAISKHIVLRGFLTAAGNLRDVKASDSRNPITEELLALLSQWLFRPAFRNQKPIDVEILLVIPARA